MDDPEKETQKLARDVERGTEVTLQRQLSGPPYSIYTSRMKIWIIFLVSVSALISPFGATLFYPVLNVLSDVLHVTPTKTNVAITTYMVSVRSIFAESLHSLMQIGLPSHRSRPDRRHVGCKWPQALVYNMFCHFYCSEHRIGAPDELRSATFVALPAGFWV
jgi:hypothetical protein